VTTTSPPAPPEPPDELSEAAAEQWRANNSRFILSASELAQLRNGLLLQDRAEQCAAIVDAEGIIIIGARGQPIENPASAAERRYRQAASATLKGLGLFIPATVQKGGRPRKTATRRV
jgi:hypothetical protein